MVRWFFFVLGVVAATFAGNNKVCHTLESRLNEISSLQARFSHEDSMGRSYQGTLFFKRPWKLRMQYDVPSPFLIVADGKSFIYEDHATHEAVYLPLDSSPLSFLLDTKTDLQKVFQVNSIEEKDDQIILNCRDKKNYFSLTLVFSTKEESILGWTSTDAQGNEVKITLHDLKKNAPLGDHLFQFQQKPRWLTHPKNINKA